MMPPQLEEMKNLTSSKSLEKWFKRDSVASVPQLLEEMTHSITKLSDHMTMTLLNMMVETEMMLLKDMDSDLFDYNEYLLIYYK